ncbi:MAG: TIGR03905 family TSCPD domain-containing protein [Clostridia bacterium]|nr:TIGR03905 family TSCPD domain-containing protein [Clostridia bacterium]
MSAYTYTPKGVCLMKIDFDVEDGILKNVKFTGGCNGNLKGISSLVDGMEVTEVIKRLKGTNCNGKGTSCPDQLAKALEAYLNTK